MPKPKKTKYDNSFPVKLCPKCGDVYEVIKGVKHRHSGFPKYRLKPQVCPECEK